MDTNRTTTALPANQLRNGQPADRDRCPSCLGWSDTPANRADARQFSLNRCDCHS